MFIPVVTSAEMVRVEKLAIAKGASEEKFMAEAGRKVALAAMEWIEREHLSKRVVLLVGKGNNGGDAFAAGLCLLEAGIQVRAIACYPAGQCSPLNQKFRESFRGKVTTEVSFQEEELILDGLLGTGFRGGLEPKLADVIKQANRSGNPILAIDLPSGLDGTSGEVGEIAIEARETVALEFPKSGLFLGKGWNYTGRLRVESFGLSSQFVPKEVGFIPKRLSLPKIVRTRHKYQAGYVVGLSGSSRFRGAPKLAGMAALRAGAGIVRIFYREEIGEAPFELICQKWTAKEWQAELKRAGSLFVGPGLGKMAAVWKRIVLPAVIDADAIQPGIEYPKQSILTPHRGEALRLFGLKKEASEEDLMARCQKWVSKHKRVLLLKGAPTFIFSVDQSPVIIPFGDPGMATAGAGDVLTGILAALLAQKMRCLEAAVLGATLHALAGERAVQDKSSYGLIAGDLVDRLPAVFQKLARTPRSNSLLSGQRSEYSF